MKISSAVLLSIIAAAATDVVAFSPIMAKTITSSRLIQSSSRMFNSNGDEESSKSEGKAPKHAPRHDAGNQIEISPEEQTIQAAFAEHQQNCAKLGFPVDVRTLVENSHGFAVISTNSKVKDGYPNGSVVGFAPDEDGNPFFIFSGMSSHTQDILKDPKCSLTIASSAFKGAADGRVNLMGQVKLVPKDERDALKPLYLENHPDAFWVDFGDFNWFKMEIERINFVGGFARAGSITPEEYKNAKPDAISAFGSHVAEHMNDDHQESTIAMIESQVPGINAQEAIITSVDSLGMFVKITRSPEDNAEQKQTFKMRLPFPREATDRKAVKEIIVEMTRAAATSATEE